MHERLRAGGALPIADEVRDKANARGVEPVAVPAAEACDLLSAVDPDEMAAILHVIC